MTEWTMIVLVGAIVAFVALRVAVLWYFRIGEAVSLLKEIRDLLRETSERPVVPEQPLGYTVTRPSDWRRTGLTAAPPAPVPPASSPPRWE